MNGWRVILSKTARRDFRQLEDGPKQAATELLEDLAEDPALTPASELRGYAGYFKARFHHDLYRMVYQIAKNQRRILVTRIRPRPIAYQGMKHGSR